MERVIQLFDRESSTFTYVLADPPSGEAIVIDPVDGEFDRDLGVLRSHGLRLVYTLETHTHADHITSSGRLREATGAQAVTPLTCGIPPADIHVIDGDTIRFGGETVIVIHTPGHTVGSVCYRWRDSLFTGDTLLIGGCGRTDFQGGDAGALYDSITTRLFTLPDSTIVYPGHDYQGATSSTIGEEKARNPRLAGRTRDEFIAIMNAFDRPKPRLIDVAVPANRRLGIPHGG